MKPKRLSFMPTLTCVDCAKLTTQGRISPMSSQAWQLVPLCNELGRDPAPASGGAEEPFAFVSDLRTIEQLRRRRQCVARAFLRLRKQNGHTKAKRALRRKLCHLCLRQAEAVEVWQHD